MLTLRPQKLSGKLQLPAPKALRQFAAVCGALSGRAVIEGWSSAGCAPLLRALSQLGCYASEIDGKLCFTTHALPTFSPRYVDELNSELIHLLTPMSMLIGGAVLWGEREGFDAPFDHLCMQLAAKGAECTFGPAYMKISGTLNGGMFEIPDDYTPYMTAGLLLALPALPQDSIVSVSANRSLQVVQRMTLELVTQLGRRWRYDAAGNCYIYGTGEYAPFHTRLDADMILASFILTANELGSRIEITNLNRDASQPGAGITQMLPQLAGRGDLDLDLSGQAELAPPLAVAAAARDGITALTGLPQKQRGDRTLPQRLAAALCGAGVSAEAADGALVIRGGRRIAGGIADADHDPLCVMMLAALSTIASGDISILGANCAEEYAPGFWRAFGRLGGGFQGV